MRPDTRPAHRPHHRGSGFGIAIPVWAGILLLPVALLIRVVTFALPEKTEDRNAEEVAGFLRDFIDGSGGEWDWDEFESVPITDPELEAIRKEAVAAGPTSSGADADFEKLGDLLRRAEALAAADRSGEQRKGQGARRPDQRTRSAFPNGH